MYRKSAPVFSATIALVLAACGSQEVGPSPVVNSNSNWLVPCSETLGCVEGTCFCGACTRICASAADCGEERPDAACVTPEATSVIEQCTGQMAPTESVCLPQCADDDDCASWQACRAGNCVTVEEPGMLETDEMDAVRPCPLDAGLYCGGELRLEADVLYTCDERGIAALSRCESGCTVIERGDDACARPSR